MFRVFRGPRYFTAVFRVFRGPYFTAVFRVFPGPYFAALFHSRVPRVPRTPRPVFRGPYFTAVFRVFRGPYFAARDLQRRAEMMTVLKYASPMLSDVI